MSKKTSKTTTTKKAAAAAASAPLLIIKGDYKGIPITIYGEEHNNIDNSVYERMDLTDKIVMVEHSTVFSELKEGQEKLFTCARGSEWVWFTRTLNAQPVICIDNRLENGFLNKLEEKDLIMYQMPIPDLITIFKQILSSVTAVKDTYKPIKEVYMNLVGIIQTQMKEIIKLNVVEKKRDDTLEYNLIQNLLKLSSLSVDMNIVQLIEKYAVSDTKEGGEGGEGREIVIFVGAAHAMRLQEILGLSLISGDISPYVQSALTFIYNGGLKKRGGKKKKTSLKKEGGKKRKAIIKRKKTLKRR